MKRDQVIGLILILFAGFMYYQATKLPPAMFGALGADVFPKLLFILLAVFGAALIVQATLKARKEAKAEDLPQTTKTGGIGHYKNVIFGFAAFCLYVILMYYLGYTISTLIFMPLLMFILAPRTKAAAVSVVLVTLALTFSLQYGFAKALKVFLPSSALF